MHHKVKQIKIGNISTKKISSDTLQVVFLWVLESDFQTSFANLLAIETTRFNVIFMKQTDTIFITLKVFSGFCSFPGMFSACFM